MSVLPPLHTLYEATAGDELPLPPVLHTLYGGGLRFPAAPAGRARVYGNFVSTLDGVVSLNVPGHSGGKEISGHSEHDRAVMGLLRAVADAVIVGAGTLRSVPRHLWTADYVYPAHAAAYQELRSRTGRGQPPLNVIVSARGEIDLQLPVFQSAAIPVLIVTTAAGAARLRQAALPSGVDVAAVPGEDSVAAAAVLEAVAARMPASLVLLEGGPHLMGDFFAASLLDELFLTLAPQVAGRDGQTPRPALVEGHSFAPDRPLWGRLTSLKQGGSHLFLRYAFSGDVGPTPPAPA